MKDVKVNMLGAYYANKLSRLSMQENIQADELIERFDDIIQDFREELHNSRREDLEREEAIKDIEELLAKNFKMKSVDGVGGEKLRSSESVRDYAPKIYCAANGLPYSCAPTVKGVVESPEETQPESPPDSSSLAQFKTAITGINEELKIKDFKVLQKLLNNELGRLDYPTRNNVGTELLDTLKLDYQADTLNELDPLLYQAFYGLVKAKVDDILKEGAEDDGAFNS